MLWRSTALLLLLWTVGLGSTLTADGTSAGNAGSTLQGLVTHVVDGDTLDVRLASGDREGVRLIGIDAPERGACYASQTSAKARSLALGKRVALVGDSTQDARDRYTRLLAYVLLPSGQDLGRVLIAGGDARVYVYFRPFVRLRGYRTAEAAARRGRLGLWSACSSGSGTTTTTSPAGRNCDPSYPTVCIPPPPPDLDCKDVPYAAFKVVPPDPHRFDGDHDGIGCEGN